MGYAILIERLYAQRRRSILALAKIDQQATALRRQIASTENELRGLVLFVVPFEQRKPHPHFKMGELSRLCRTVLRERKSRSLYSGEIAATVMKAKGLSPSDPKLAPMIFRQTQDALRRMWERGVVTKAGHGVRARWGLPEG